jgi:hypothetical protein
MHPYKAQPTGTSPGLVNASGVGINAYGVVVRGGGLYEMDFWFIGVQIEAVHLREQRRQHHRQLAGSTAPRSVKFGAPLCLHRTGRV